MCRWSLCGSGLSERKAALLKLSLEAATCAQRDRFAEQPARAVAAAAAATAATADYIIQDVSDPMVLQPAWLDTVSLRQADKPLGFDVVPSFCGHHQLADIRFGSPAHASGAVHNGDEIVQVGAACVVGWSGAAVLRQCARAGPLLALRLRRRAVSCSTGLELSPRPRTCLGVVLDRAPPVPSGPGLAPQGPGLAPSGPQPSDEAAASDRNRGKLDKSHSTPAYDFDASLDEPGPLAAQTIPESPTTPTDSPLALHATDKADRILDFKKSSSQIGEAIQRGRRSNADERSVPAESEPHAEDDMFAGDRDESATERILETINIAMMEHRRRTERAGTDDTYRPQPAPRPAPPPRPAALGPPGGAGAKPGGRAPPQFPVLRAVPRPEDPPTSPLKPIRPVDATHISVPLRHITKHDIRIIPSERHEMPAINSPVSEPVAMGLGSPGAGPAGSLRRRSPGPPGAGTGDIVMGAHVNTDSSSGKGHALSPTSAVRGIFPNSKSRSLKKKSSILASEYSIWSNMVAGCM
ncbi:connector enhancer of kinase suppressor of ras 3-like [Spodoptera litura]|uniref:Connector enhancer of kinase suppressor of ras 3-like n=1 Tax=Spodoptera litura TaxID=69820 RepID=A0A9J7J5D6_SPOLT|nr:connector enhancer of kinase suppressor of ras 3-like [Spodoptera litura]